MENEILFKFREHLKVLGRSGATIEAYGEHVEDFLKTAGDVKKVALHRRVNGLQPGDEIRAGTWDGVPFQTRIRQGR